jgi:hypothetical protein
MHDPSSSRHFWIVASKMMQSSLVVIPRGGEGSEESSARLQVFDADGDRCNDTTLKHPRCQSMLFECEPLLEGCKVESGFRHAHLAVETTPGTTAYVRYTSNTMAVMVQPFAGISAERPGCIPVHLSAQLSSVASVTNLDSEPIDVKVRLVLAKRSPETVWRIPANGVRLFDVGAEFAPMLGEDSSRDVRGYLRLSLRTPARAGVQLLTRNEKDASKEFFQVVSY